MRISKPEERLLKILPVNVALKKKTNHGAPIAAIAEGLGLFTCSYGAMRSSTVFAVHKSARCFLDHGQKSF